MHGEETVFRENQNVSEITVMIDSGYAVILFTSDKHGHSCIVAQCWYIIQHVVYAGAYILELTGCIELASFVVLLITKNIFTHLDPASLNTQLK